MEIAQQEGQEILFQAVQYDNVELLTELLAENSELARVKCPNGRTALHVAAASGLTKCAELLLQAGAEIDSISGRADALRTPLVMAAVEGHSTMVELLVANGAELFYYDEGGNSALQMAQKNGHSHCAHLLLSVIEQIYENAKAKNKCLCSACVDGDLLAVQQMLTDLGHNTIRKQILNGDNPEQKSALFLAVENGRNEIVEALLTISGHSIIFEPSGDTILHAAIASKSPETIEAILHKFPFLMDAANQEKCLPLHWACRCGNAAIVHLLLEMDYSREDLKFFEFPSQKNVHERLGYLFPCDLNASDQTGYTALHLAVKEHHLDIVRVLANFKLPVFNGSDPYSQTDNEISSERMECPFLFDTYVNGRTPLMVACANGDLEIVRILLQSGCVDANLPIALTEEELTSSTVEAHCTDGSGALIEAARRGNFEMIRLLFLHGAFDYGNRALAQLDLNDAKQLGLAGIFLKHLIFPDTEHRIQRPNKSEGIDRLSDRTMAKISTATGNLLAKQPSSSADLQSLKDCRLNWAATGTPLVKAEWFVEAAIHLNPQIPTSSLALMTITAVDLSANQLTAIPAFIFTQLQSLHLLNLAKNEIGQLELPPDGANWQCPCLKTIFLDENRLEELPAQLFSQLHFPQIRHVNVSSNRLRRLPPSLWTAPRLLELNLADNQLNELNSLDYRRSQQQHNHLYRQQQGAAGRISRHRRREKEDKSEENPPSSSAFDPNERQSRPIKRESPQKSKENSRRGSKGTESGGSGQEKRSRGGTLVELDIQRVNIWQNRIQLSNIEDSKAGELEETYLQEKSSELRQLESPLQVLNLSGNKFTRMPTCLACCCPRLKRLDISRNFLTNLGPVECLPSALCQLDVSGNRLNRCFAEHTTQLRQKRNCEAADLFIQAGMPNGGGQFATNSSRHSRSRSKSVARSQRSLSMVRNQQRVEGTDIQNTQIPTGNCWHKVHCRFEALRSLNLSNNALNALELLIPLEFGNEAGKVMNEAELAVILASAAMEQMGGAEAEVGKRFDWKEGGEQLKSYILFPSLTSLDISGNQLRQLPPFISLLGSLAILNLANNADLEQLPPELGLLEKLWNIGLNGCKLEAENQQIRTMVQASNYKTVELLSYLRQRLENSIAYPKMKLMFLGGSGVGKSTLLHHMRLEGNVPKKSLQHESWSRRMGHSPAKEPPPSSSSPSHVGSRMSRSSSQQRIGSSNSLYPVEVGEWTFEPRYSSKSRPESADTLKGPITFRTWDFDGIKQREQLAVQICFFTRRCLYLLLWKVTDGEIALAELQEWLIAIQERAPNSYVLIVGTHADFVREQTQRFPQDYLATLDRQIQERFIAGVDPEKRGLPRLLGSIYMSSRSREDVKSLCNLVYICAAHSATGRSGSKLKLSEKVPASFVALERVVVNMTDDMRVNRREPILYFDQFWSLAREKLLLFDEKKQKQAEKRVQFRDVHDFRQACLFLHENGVICYFDDTLLRQFIFLDPQWLCLMLQGIFTSIIHQRPAIDSLNSSSPSSPANLSQVHQNSLIESTEIHSAMKGAMKRFLTSTISSPAARPSEHSVAKQFRLFRLCAISLLNKFELALPCQNGKTSLLASFLPDEYLLRADYPGARVRMQTKFDKIKLRWKDTERPRSYTSEGFLSSPIRSYLEHRRLSRTVAAAGIDGSGQQIGTPKEENTAANEINDFVKILSIEQCKEKYLRRLYLMHFVPQGFWPRLITRLMDDERLGNVISKMFLLSRVSNPEEAAVNADESLALARTLNSGRVLNLMQKTTPYRNGQREEGETGEAETSFIVLNLAEEVTEEASASSFDDHREQTSIVQCCEKGVEASDEERDVTSLDGNGIEWLLWRTGLEVRSLGNFLLSLRQFLPLASVQDLNYSTHQLFRQFEDGQWRSLTTTSQEGHQLIELLVPMLHIRLKWRDALWELVMDEELAAKQLVLVTSIIDDLLEDWYPQLGIRFAQSSQGLFLVDRLIPCERCAIESIQEEERYWLRENINRNPAASPNYQPTGKPARSASMKFGNQQRQKGARRLPKSNSSTTTPLGSEQQQNGDAIGLNKASPIPRPSPSPVHLFSMEECVLEARKALKRKSGEEHGQTLACPRHGHICWGNTEGPGPSLARMCPDLLFADLRNDWLVNANNIHMGKMLGRGAFGFVFTGTLLGQFRRRSKKQTADIESAALKVYEPAESSMHPQIGGSAQQAAFRAFALKWQNDPMEQGTRAYLSARQELCMLSELSHPHCTQLLAFSTDPLTLVLELAPSGSLDKILAEFRRCGQQLQVETLQATALQIAKALEYLHVQQHIIYRDLKSENVLVWRFPMPNLPGRPKTGPGDVLLKLGDFGISRFSYPSGICKGYGGTEGFMAPEIMRYNGEQEYSERVDCFSFGMFLYELLTLRQPYEGHQLQQMKERILEAQRPNVTEKELLYPTNMLDLLVSCWAEQAEHRPSSSQLVGICTAPEFGHLVDIALLKDGEDAGEEEGVVALLQAVQSSPGEEGQQSWICWIPMATEGKPAKAANSQRPMFSLLQASKFGWTDKKIYLPSLLPTGSPSKRPPRQHQQQRPTAIAQVNEQFLVVGDESGTVGFFAFSQNALPMEEPLFSADLAKMMERQSSEMPVHEPLMRRTSSSSSPSPFAVLRIETFPERQILIFGLRSAVLLCRWLGRDSELQLVTSIQLKDEHLHSMTILPSLGDWQIWTGHSEARIFMHHISSSTGRLAFSTSASHFQEQLDGKQAQPKKVVAFLIASKSVKNLVWSAMKKDPKLFMWRDSQLRKMLNCEKILPVSESLSSLELNGPETRDSITAMELLDLGGTESQEQLLVGTKRGILLVIKAAEMSPLSCFRPYAGPVLRILGCPPDVRRRPSTCRILQNELLSAANIPTIPPTLQPEKQAKKRSAVLEKSRSMLKAAAGLQQSTEDKSSVEGPERRQSLDGRPILISEVRSVVDEFCEAVKSGMRGMFGGEKDQHAIAGGEEETFFVTIGSDYRPLLDRFVANPSVVHQQVNPNGGQADCSAIFWRATTHWASHQPQSE